MGSKGDDFNVRKLNMKVKHIKNAASEAIYITVFKAVSGKAVSLITCFCSNIVTQPS